MTHGEWRRLRIGLLFVSPWIVGFLLFGLYPIGMAVYYAFCDYDILRSAVWVGSLNYRDLWSDDVFHKALANTLVYAVFSVPLSLVLALAVAVLLHRPIRGRALFRTLFYLPSILPLIAVGMIWMWVFNGRLGLVNHALLLVGLDGPDWLQDPAWTRTTLILTSTWQMGGAMVLFLAALQDVPHALHESADLDGAGPVMRFLHITFPMVLPVVYFNLVIGLIAATQEFVKPFIIFGGGMGGAGPAAIGGPDRSVLLLAMYIYHSAFLSNRMGYACAMAMVLFVLVGILTWLVARTVGARVHYAGEGA